MSVTANFPPMKYERPLPKKALFLLFSFSEIKVKMTRMAGIHFYVLLANWYILVVVQLVANCLSHLPHYTENITTGKGSKSMVNDIPSSKTILAKKG